MRQSEFLEVMNSLRTRFGERAFDTEFNKQLLELFIDMEKTDFEKIAKGLIGTRRHTNPPLIVDFREAIYRHEQDQFQRGLKQSYQKIYGDYPTSNEGLKKYLGYLEVNSVSEAIELRAKEIKENSIGDRRVPEGASQADVYGFARLDMSFQHEN